MRNLKHPSPPMSEPSLTELCGNAQPFPGASALRQEVLLAWAEKVLINGSEASQTIAMRGAHLFSMGGTPASRLSPNERLQGKEVVNQDG